MSNDDDDSKTRMANHLIGQYQAKSWIADLNEETARLHAEVKEAFRSGWWAGASDSNAPKDEQEIAFAHDWKNYESKRKIK